MRVRNFEPSTPMRRSANSLRRLRNRTKVRATNNREMRKVRAQKTRISSLLPGRRKFGSKAFCETRMASRSRTATASRMMACLRPDFFGARVRAGWGTVVPRPGRGVAGHYRWMVCSCRRPWLALRRRWGLRFLRRDGGRGGRRACSGANLSTAVEGGYDVRSSPSLRLGSG